MKVADGVGGECEAAVRDGVKLACTLVKTARQQVLFKWKNSENRLRGFKQGSITSHMFIESVFILQCWVARF